MSKKLYIIAGEASGDLHGSNLIKELKQEDPTISIRCWGGDLMKNAGGDIVKHYRDLAFMGFVSVLLNIRTILKNISFCKNDILSYKPDAIVLIDYPGFNLKIAAFGKKHNIKVFYYISPKVWAWNQKRANKIKRIVDKMYTIFPFETEFYKKFDYEVEYVGNPLLDEIEQNITKSVNKADIGLNAKPVLALLPGSRKHEIENMLPIMLEATKYYPKFQIVIAGAPSLSIEYYRIFVKNDVVVLFDRTYDLLKISDLALVTSGTATLETGLFGVPQVVCYKGDEISYRIARSLIKVNYISLVNLVLDKEVVKELIQHDLTVDNLRKEIDELLYNETKKQQLQQDYAQLRESLGKGGASKKVASSMLKTLEWQ